MRPSYPFVQLEDHEYKTLWKDQMYSPQETVSYTLTGTDVQHWKGHEYEFLAQKFYGNSKLWWLIYDANKNVPPDSLEEGVQIQIPVVNPLDFVMPISSGR